MKIVIAIDSMKGSLSSMEGGMAVREGILRAIPDAEVTVMPLADGGEGTTDALTQGLGGRRITVTVTGPEGRPVKAFYGYLEDSRTAVMEMAAAAGITLVPPNRRSPMTATTQGVGEMILDGIRQGCETFLMGIGGSATNDGGIGMLKALGFEFLDNEGRNVGEGAQALKKICHIRTEHADPRLSRCQFRIACDVTNPLCGPNGATYIYGPQKGVTEEQKTWIDRGMANFANVTARTLGKDFRDAPGAGAAGGLAKQYGARVIAFAGSVTPDARACNGAGIDAFFPILRQISTLEQAMMPEQARQNLADTAEQVFRLL